jgi:glycine betaine/choline ABC-type transport system substrate-binding protein
VLVRLSDQFRHDLIVRARPITARVRRGGIVATPVRVLLVGALAVAAGCAQTHVDGPAASGPRIDTQLVFGGTRECVVRDLCLGPKEQRVYGLRFKEVKQLDEGGPITSKALKNGTIQVGELFTASSVIDPSFVLLADDKQLQPADFATALVRVGAVTHAVRNILDAVNAKLDLTAYNRMSTAVDVDKVEPREAAKDFLDAAGLDARSTEGAGRTLRAGAMNFTGARVISEAYAQALQGHGYTVVYQDDIGPRERVYAMLQRGALDLYGEFTGSLLTFLKGTPTGDAHQTYADLQARLQGTGLAATTPSTAEDVNGFYVTKATAERYKLVTMSDLTKPS